MPSPFLSSASKPGAGDVHLALLDRTPTFSTLTYTYPLKLLPSNPHKLQTSAHVADETKDAEDANARSNAAQGLNGSASPHDTPPPLTPALVPLLFLLTYGGGLLSTDHIALTLTLSASTRLTLITQGSTKIYKPSSPSSPPSQKTSTQNLTCTLHPNSALFYAPHPTQPFASSHYAQTQIFTLHKGASLGLLDWLSEGRRARGESWALGAWRGRNEVWTVAPSADGGQGKRRLLLRDSLILSGEGLKTKMENLGVFGTLILVGPLLQSLAEFFIEEFALLPRIGARDWGEDQAKELQGRDKWRKERQEREKRDGAVWTVAKVRGGRATIVKFGAGDVEGGREWLGAMLREEGNVGREFGPGALMGVN